MARKFTRKMKGGVVNINDVKLTIGQLKDDVSRISNDIEKLGQDLELNIVPQVVTEDAITTSNNVELIDNKENIRNSRLRVLDKTKNDVLEYAKGNNFIETNNEKLKKFMDKI